MAHKDGIKVHSDVEATCLGCFSSMPYRTTEETFDGHTIEVPLRYCENCHKAQLSELETARKAANFHARAIGMIVDSVIRAQK